MGALAVVAAFAAVYAAVNFRDAGRLWRAPDRTTAAMAALALPPVILFLHPGLRGYSYFAAPLLWAAAVSPALFGGGEDAEERVLDLLLGLACTASFLMPGRGYAPVLLSAGLVILLVLSADIYSKLNGKSPQAAMLFGLFTAALCDAALFSGLHPAARFFCAGLVTAFLAVRQGPAHAASGAAFFEKAFPVLLLQMFLAAMLKSPFLDL